MVASVSSVNCFNSWKFGLYTHQNKIAIIYLLVNRAIKLSHTSFHNAAYLIDCNECTAAYVGQTERQLCIKVNEHMKKCENKDRGSAIFTHMEEFDHKFNFNKVEVLHTEQSLDKR